MTQTARNTGPKTWYLSYQLAHYAAKMKGAADGDDAEETAYWLGMIRTALDIHKDGK